MTLSAPHAVIERARKIKIILFDVDGVLTDGSIWLIPVPVQSNHGTASKMVEAKGYNAHDGTAISLARLGGLKCGIITKRISETVQMRARDLKLEFVYLGQAFKMKPVREIMEKEGVTLDEIAYVGDDVIDLPVMRECGFAVAVADARERVKAEAHYVTPNRGGHGAARDAVEFILEAKGVLDQCIEAYIDESNPISPSMDIGKGGDQQEQVKDMSSLERLQAWYLSHCDDDWEHSYGIKISTLDNPGWMVEIDLNETELEGCEFEKIDIERSENDWLVLKREEMKVRIACGPRNLEEVLAVFCDWAERTLEGK